MVTDHLNTTASLFDLFHESELCPDEILTIFQTLDDNIDIFDAATAAAPGPLMDEKNSSINNKNKRRKKPAKTASSSPGFGSDEESDEDHALFSQRKHVKRQKASPPAISMEDGSGEDGRGADGSNNNGKVVSHITVERNKRKQMNEHLAVLRQLMPCFYVKKGDQASIIGGVIDYINELQQVLQSLEAKKQRMIYTNEVGQSPRLLVPQQQSNPNLPVSPVTPQSYKPLRQPLIQSTSMITSPTSNTNSSCSSIADMISTMMNIYNNNISNNAVANELVASSNSSIADVEVKFCGPNLELKTLSPKLFGQTVKIVSAIEDVALEILQVSINTVEETMLNAFTIKVSR